MQDRTPILVGSGQIVLRALDAPEQVVSPVELAARAVRGAIDSTGGTGLESAVDVLAMTRAFLDSAEFFQHPFGTSSRPPLSVAERLGLAPHRLVYGEEGGQSPQRLVNEFAAEIYNGNCALAVLCGAEATAAIKQAQRRGWHLDWREDPAGEIEDRGCKPLWTDLELRHHITFPPQVYTLFENAWRHRQGLDVTGHRQLMGRLFARFSEIAAANPYAQFPLARSAEFLATPSAENYPVTEPYTRWLVAQDAVNQAAAVILTSVGRARELGIPADRWLYLHGYGDADDTFVTRRTDLASSVAMRAAFDAALGMAGKTGDDIDLLDLYSCFPIAVLAACGALDIDWRAGRDLTVTGGLPFFGGPGNNYSLHAIAEMHRRLREAPGAFGLVGANGGYLSKQSAGIYSTTPVTGWRPRAGNPAQERVCAAAQEAVRYPFDGPACIETYSLVYRKSAPDVGFILARDDGGRRVLAMTAPGDEATLRALVDPEPIGRRVQVRTTDQGAFFTF